MLFIYGLIIQYYGIQTISNFHTCKINIFPLFSVTSFFHLLQLLTYFSLDFLNQGNFSLAILLLTIRICLEPALISECLEENLRPLSISYFQPGFLIPALFSLPENKCLIRCLHMGIRSLISATTMQQIEAFPQYSGAFHSVL